MIAFLFPGQGSQKRGIGQGLFDEVPEYVAVEKDVDEIVGYSLRKLCLEEYYGDFPMAFCSVTCVSQREMQLAATAWRLLYARAFEGLPKVL